MKLRSNKGFSLVELIIVIAILGIIALIAVPNLTGIQKRSQVNADIRTAEQIGKAVRIWLTDASITTTNAREEKVESYVDYSTLTSAGSEAYGSLGGYVSLDYKPQSLNDGEFYVKLDSDGRVNVLISTDGSAGDTAAYKLDDTTGAAAAGVAYIEGVLDIASELAEGE